MALVPSGGRPNQEAQEFELARRERDVVTELEDKLREEERVRDEQRSNPRRRGVGEGAGGYYVTPFTEHHFGRPLEYRGAVKPFPPAILESFAQLQISSYQGLFPEMHRAWVTIDNVIYIWDYLTEQSVCIIDALEQVVVSVGLARPNYTVFADFIQYVLIAATPTTVHLFALAFSDGTAEGALDVRATDFHVSTDGVIMKKIVGTMKGRIFMAGGDGNVYEMLYEHEGDSIWQQLRLQNKCRKLSISSTPYIPPITFVHRMVGYDTSELIDIVVDEARNILYSLSAQGLIQVYDLGADGLGCRHVSMRQEDLFRKAEIYCRKNGTGNEQRFKAPHRFKAISLHVVAPTDSRIYHLVAISDAGFRFYLQTATGEVGPNLRPERLDVVDIRLPPQSTIWDEINKEDLTERKQFPPDWVSQSPITYHHAFYSSPGVLIMAEGQAGAARDHVVGFCEDGSASLSEVVCELTPGTQSSMDSYGGGGGGVQLINGRDFGRIRAIAEEPFIQFPITDRDRHLDQLRYLMSTSSTPDADQRRAMEGPTSYSRMVSPYDAPRDPRFTAAIDQAHGGGDGSSLGTAMVRTIGPWVTHLASRFGVALGENAQAMTSSRLFIILTTTGIHVVARVRPIDVMINLLASQSRSLEDRLRPFEMIYGPEETCALLYLIASQVPPDVGYPVGRGLLAHAGYPINMKDIVEKAKATIRSWYSRLDPRQSPHLLLPPPPSAATSGLAMSNFSHQYKGLVTAFSRIVRPVWLKPLVVEENVPVAPLWVLFLQPPETRSVLDPLLSLRDTLTQLYPSAIRDSVSSFFNPPNSDKIDQNRMEDVQVRLLYHLLERTLHALRLLLHLAEFWRDNKRIRLPLEEIQAWTVADLVTKRDAHQKIKVIMAQVLQPNDELSATANDLTNRLSTDCFLYFSQGDQLVFEARKEILKAHRLGVDSAERRERAQLAASFLVRAAVYWRTKADVDALDGGLDRHGRRTAHDGLALQLLKLTVNDPEVLSAIVDMCMLAALNFGAKSYTPPTGATVGPWLGAHTGNSAASLRAKKEYEAAALGSLDEGTITALRQRCFNIILDAIGYLTLPAQRNMEGLGVPPNVGGDGDDGGDGGGGGGGGDGGDAIGYLTVPTQRNMEGLGVPPNELENRARDMMYRALFSQDYDFHRALYQWLIRNNMDEMLYEVTTPHEQYILACLRGLQDRRESVERQHKFFTCNGRHVDAMELMEKVAVDSSSELSLDERIAYLERAKGSARLASQAGGWESGQRFVSENREALLNDLLDIGKMQQRLRDRFRALPGPDPEVGSDLDRIEHGGFCNAAQLYQIALKYSLWAELLLIINMCASNSAIGDHVKVLWLSIIYDSLPCRANNRLLEQWYEKKASACPKQWGPQAGSRPVGRQDGELDDHNGWARMAVMEKVKSLAEEMNVRDGQPHPAFPLEYIMEELLELEYRLDEARGSDAWTHLTWQKLAEAGVGYKDLFKAHVEILKKLREPVDQRRHVLSSVRDLTKRWWEQLKNDPTGGSTLSLLDRSTQGFVVRQLEQLSSSQFGSHTNILNDLARLKTKFQYYPDMMDEEDGSVMMMMMTE